MTVGDVVQFNLSHKWSGSLGIISEDKGTQHPRRYLIGVPMPENGAAYVFDDGSNIEYIGKAIYVMRD